MVVRFSLSILTVCMVVFCLNALSAIETISLSTATDPNSKALKDLATLMLDDAEFSLATSKGYSDKISKTPIIKDPGVSSATSGKVKFNTGTTSFSYLNN